MLLSLFTAFAIPAVVIAGVRLAEANADEPVNRADRPNRASKTKRQDTDAGSPEAPPPVILKQIKSPEDRGTQRDAHQRFRGWVKNREGRDRELLYAPPIERKPKGLELSHCHSAGRDYGGGAKP